MSGLNFLSHKNDKSFAKVCKGHFGRKVIYSDVDVVTKNNVQDVLSKALLIHNQNKTELDYLWHYVNGDQPILYRKKQVRPEIKNDVVENHAWEITRFMMAQNFGEPIQYVCVEDDEELSKQVDLLNKYMRVCNKPYYDIQIGDWQSTGGTSYREIWAKSRLEVDDGEPCLGIDSPDPRFNFIIYSNAHGNPALMSVSELRDSDEEDYYVCTTPDYVFTIKGDDVKTELNGYGKVLLIEYPNNARRLSDVEIVITLTDAMNKIQSNRVDGVEQFVQAFIKFVNCEIDETTFLKMCKIGALKVKTVNPSMPADVGMVSSQLDQQQTQVSKDDLYKNMLIIEGMPSREQNTGGDTGQAVYLRNGWDFAEQRAKIDEPVTQKAERESLKLILRILKTKEQISEDLKISDIDIKITRNKTDNMLVKAQALIYLLEKGIHPKIAIKTCDLWGDPEKVYTMSKPYLDGLFKTAAEMQAEADLDAERQAKVNNSYI